MKGQTFDINSAISMGNQVIGLIPKLMALAYFIMLALLTWHVVKSVLARQKLDTMQLCAIAIAFGLAMR